MSDALLHEARDIPWLPRPNVVRVERCLELPPERLITAAHTLAFDGDRLLMADLYTRGWSVPGGHLDRGETALDAAVREAYEETGAVLDELRLFSSQHIRLECDRPAGYPYPHPDSYQVMYLARVVRLEDFGWSIESDGGALFAPGEARAIPWVERNRALYEAALSAAAEIG